MSERAQLYQEVIADRDATVEQLRRSPEIESLTSTLDVYDLNSIVTFGRGAADRISEAADKALRSASQSADGEGGALMEAMSAMLSSFDPGDTGSSFLDRLFGGNRALDRLIDRYTRLGAEVDGLYTRLRTYEEDIRRSNEALNGLYDANAQALGELEKYIVAGEQGCAEIEAYKNALQAQPGRDAERGFEINTLEQALSALRGRVHDLKLCEAVALQALPTVRLMQYNNAALQRKINASLIVTLPVFRQALAQAITLKRQKTQSDAIKALEKRTQEVLRRSGRPDAAEAAREALRSAGAGGEIDVGAAYRALSEGVSDTRRLRDEARAENEANEKRLQELKDAWNRSKTT